MVSSLNMSLDTKTVVSYNRSNIENSCDPAAWLNVTPIGNHFSGGRIVPIGNDLMRVFKT